MFTTLMHRAVRLMPLLKPNRRLLIGGAWLFIIFSLAHLAWVISIKWGDPAGLTIEAGPPAAPSTRIGAPLPEGGHASRAKPRQRRRLD